MNAADLLLGADRIARSGHAQALVWRGGAVTYRTLLSEVNRSGNALRALGVMPEQRVILLLKDTPAMVAAYLGAIKTGAVAVALNVRLGAPEVAHILADSRAALVVADHDSLPLFEAAAAHLQQVPSLAVVGGTAGVVRGAAAARRSTEARPSTEAVDFDAVVKRESERLAATDMARDDMAFWIYTSGTTGTPKAAVHLHHDVETATDYAQGVLGIGPDDRLYATSKLFFAYALGNCLFASFQLGATTILSDAWPDSSTVADVIDRHRPTVLFSVPAMYRNLLRDGVVTPERMSGIRCAVSAGERLPAVIFERYREASGGRAIIDGIGTSETIYMFLSNPPGAERAGSAGRPLPGLAVERRDDQGRRVTDSREPGVLWVRMPSTADRYWNQQERSQRSFVGDWFCTGDLFVTDEEGYWYHEGRADDMLKISGQWVSPAEIEDEVLAVPGVADAAVTGRPDADGLVRLALFIVASPEAPDDLEERIRTRLAAMLAIYKCPRRIHLVPEIPRTATGKIQRYKLRESTP